MAELAIAARAGDGEAAGELYRRTHAAAWQVARAFCAEVDADDAVAEGLSTALRRIGQLRDPTAVEAWMVRSVVRCAIDLSRQRRRQSPTDGIAQLVDAHMQPGESAAERAMLALERRAMAQAVRDLRPDLRLLLYLRYEAGLSVQHIASALGKPAGTIRRQCVEARHCAGQRFLCHHLRPAAGRCVAATTYLCQAPYRRPGSRARRRASEHLQGCAACRERQVELAVVLAEMGVRRSQAPL